MKSGAFKRYQEEIEFCQDLITNHASAEEILQSVHDYEHAFHKFVDTHENYLRFEDDEKKVTVTKENYDKEKEHKFSLDVDISK